jgi:competence ComEA-like helix-hairpin-helix protein
LYEIRVHSGGSTLLVSRTDEAVQDALETLGQSDCLDVVRQTLKPLKSPSLLVLTPSNCGIQRIHEGMLSGTALVLLQRPMDLSLVESEDLQAISGIGEKLADQIVHYRNQHGPVCDIDELRAIKGLGPKKLDVIRRYVEARCP